MARVEFDHPDRLTNGLHLKASFRRTEIRRSLTAVCLVLPLFIFLVLTFAVPIGTVLFRSVYDNTLAMDLPQTLTALRGWSGTGLPDEAAYAALAGDLRDDLARRTIAAVGKRMNYEMPGARSSVMSSARAMKELKAGPYKQALIDLDPIWGQTGTWNLLKRSVNPYTPFYVLRALDFQYDELGHVVSSPPDVAVFRAIFLRTFLISSIVTATTLVLGYLVAKLLASLPERTSNLLMIMVLLPFWTSLLVRTTAWVVLLQEHGVINDTLISMHVISQPLDLVFNRLGTIIAMTHIQLPFTLLPIYSVMKNISPSHVRAARSLGAGPFYAFWRIYFPQTVPGIAAGCLLTFILCLGYYITPALVGGPTDQMISYFVARYTNQELNWGMASALAGILLSATLVLYYVYNRIVGIDRLSLG